jgi:Cdc6-like AAA superfamily ATPase
MTHTAEFTRDDLPPLVDRDPAYTTVANRLLQQRERCLHLHGPHGSGKTLLLRHVLQDLPASTTVCPIFCRRRDTQYKVLTTLCEAVTDEEFTTGYHTAQLYAVLADAAQELTIVLDDIDFLLMNDGNDLLYTLSRLNHPGLQLVLSSANHPNLATELDDRTYSSLQPSTVDCPAYTETEAIQILRERVADWINQPVTDDAFALIVSVTTNIRIGYHWLRVAAEVVDGQVTRDIVRLVQPDADQRYRTAQLAAFTEHHHLLLDAIELLTAETSPVRSGDVYDSYHRLCNRSGTAPLSTRRISDFLTQLELLNLIRVEYQYGGDDGKTRSIWLQELSQ